MGTTRSKAERRRGAPIAITSGDHRGIGPEVIAKGLHALRRTVSADKVVIFGEPALYGPFKRLLPAKWRVWEEEEAADWAGPARGQLNFIVPRAGHVAGPDRDAFLCGRYVELAALGALRGAFSALTTGPVNKNVLQRGGFPYDGHTEMLQALCGSGSATMMLAGPLMRTSLVTVHKPLREVSASLSTDGIVHCIGNTISGLRRDFGIRRPSVAVLGLNPHAGDDGLFGREEAELIAPAIEQARSRFANCRVDGPFPPDGFFAQWPGRFRKSYDAIVCMYHDQGLIPIKLLDFRNVVNVTLGLPIVRTSVDHGVGYDIAGKNRADPGSFCAALRLALEISRRRTAGRGKG